MNLSLFYLVFRFKFWASILSQEGPKYWAENLKARRINLSWRHVHPLHVYIRNNSLLAVAEAAASSIWSSAMDLESNYEIAPTADFIYSRNFTRVALQVTLNKPPNQKKKKMELPKTLEIFSRFLILCLVSEKTKRKIKFSFVLMDLETIYWTKEKNNNNNRSL